MRKALPGWTCRSDSVGGNVMVNRKIIQLIQVMAMSDAKIFRMRALEAIK